MANRFRDDPKPFVTHLNDLRISIRGMLFSWGIGTLLAIPLCPYIIKLLRYPVSRAGYDPDEMLRFVDATDGIMIAMRTIMWSGFVISLPALVFFAVRFVFPGLKGRERGMVAKMSIAAGVLFVAGLAMGYFITLPEAIKVLLRVNAWMGFKTEFLRPGGYLMLAIKLLAAFGLAFELPILLLGLGVAGLVDSELLRAKRRHVIIALFVLAMILTPPDPLTQVMMAIPLVVLYEICIWIIRLREIARSRE